MPHRTAKVSCVLSRPVVLNLGTMSQFQEFGCLVRLARLCTNTVYSYIHTHVLNLKEMGKISSNYRGSVPTTRLRTTGLDTSIYEWLF